MSRRSLFERVAVVSVGLGLVMGSGGCSLLTDFDESKIPTLLAEAGIDATAFDASGLQDARIDGTVPDGGRPDASDAGPDGTTGDGSTPGDAGDGGVTDDGGDDGSTADDGGGDGSTGDDGGDAGGGDAGDPDAGACTDAGDCADNNPCTVDLCVSGQCTHDALTCAANQCETAACNPGTGLCETTNKPPSELCNDGSRCTLGDHCDGNGACIGGTAVTCGAPNQCQTGAGTCNPSTGTCTFDSLPDTTSCDDNSLCTTGDHCNGAGACVGTAPTCNSPPSQCHVSSGQCNPDNGQCEYQFAEATVACNDGSACTTGDHCNGSGICVAGSSTVCPAAGQCQSGAGVCNPGSGVCEYTNASNTTACNDGNACTTIDLCDGSGACVGNAPITCGPAGQCQVGNGTCNPTSGTCEYQAAAPGDSCNDGIACTTSDQCGAGGACAGTPDNGLCTDPLAPICVAGSGCQGTFATQVTITEFNALGTAGATGEFVELRNGGALAGSVAGFAVVINGVDQIIHAVTDRTGANNTPVPLVAGGYAWGAPNNGTIPVGASFVYGPVDTTPEIPDTGDQLILRSNVGATLDTVDFRTTGGPGFVTSGTPTTAQFPGLAGKSTQVDPAHVTGSGHNDGANWCVTGGSAADTRGAANGSCSTIVINEVLAHAPGNDEGRAFVELAGPGGASLTTLQIVPTEDSGSEGTPYLFTAGTRMPLDGVLVFASGNASSVTTVPDADVVVPRVLFTGTETGVRLYRGAAVVDALGWSTGSGNTVAEGTAVTTFEPANPVSYARAQSSADTGNNAADFHYDPTPSPGAANAPVNPTIVSVDRSEGLANVGNIITVYARDFADATLQAVDSVSPICAIAQLFQDGRDGALYRCTVPARAGGAVRGALTLQNPAAVGASVSAGASSWTYSQQATGTNRVSFCNLQFPTAMGDVAQLTDSAVVYSRFRHPGYSQGGLTPPGDPALRVQLGFGEGNPTTDPGYWTWTNATRNTGFIDADTDEYQAHFTTPFVSSDQAMLYTYRYSVDDGLNWTYCDTNGVGQGDAFFTADDFQVGNAGTMTVKAGP